MYNLTPDQKDLLRWIVTDVRAKKMPEEFSIAWGQDGPLLHFAGSNGFYKLSDVTRGALDALAANHLLHLRTRDDDVFGTRHCTLMGKAYEAVDRAFSRYKPNRIR